MLKKNDYYSEHCAQLQFSMSCVMIVRGMEAVRKRKTKVSPNQCQALTKQNAFQTVKLFFYTHTT
jgi:hypothetical protein